MIDYQAELNKANKAYNLYCEQVKDLLHDYERECEIAEKHYSDQPGLMRQERVRLANSGKYKKMVVKMGEMQSAIRAAEQGVKGHSFIVETEDPLWWAMLDDADKRNPHHVATKFDNFQDMGTALARPSRGSVVKMGE